MTKMMSDLSGGLIAKILSRVPMTSLRSVRSTCKKWNALSKSRIFCKTAAKNQFLGFMMMDNRVCSIKLDLQGIGNDNQGDLVDPSIKQISVLDQIEVSKVFHCDGLVLCIMKDDNSRLLVWNPYLGQTRWIQPRIDFHRLDSYVLGYDNNRHHKMLRFVDDYPTLSYQVYEFSSNSWRILDVTPDWNIEFDQGGVSLKGNTYFYAQEKLMLEPEGMGHVTDLEVFLLCFDFTAERYGPRLPLPFHSRYEETVTLSCVREEKLVVLYQRHSFCIETTEIWVTTKIEPNAVLWSKFLKVDMRPFPGIMFDLEAGSFFIEEEKKLAVVFDLDGYKPTETCRYQTAHIIGQDGYFKSVNIGEAPNLGKPNRNGYTFHRYCFPLVCSSYLPSLVEIN